MGSNSSAHEVASFLKAIGDLAPEIIRHHSAIDRDRMLPAELVSRLADAGFFTLWRAHALGGPELSFNGYARIIEELSRSDASVGWCAMVTSVLSRLSGFLDEHVAREIFGDARTIVAGSINPSGKAVVVPGGYNLTGHWNYGSFIQHSEWTVANSMVLEGDTPRRDASGAPDIRFMIVPTSKVEIIDNWYVSGLKGTGSSDFKINDVFVPEDHALSAFAAKPVQPGAIFATPLITIFAASIPPVSLGIARCAIEAFAALAASKTPTGSALKLRDKPSAQAAIGRAQALVDAARSFLVDSVATVYDELAAGDTPSLHQRAIVRLAAAHAAASSAQAVDLLHDAAGATALFESSPIERCFRDVHATTQHIGTSSSNFEIGGRVLLGLEPGTQRF